ncbi:alpha/beta hydrolase family protein [Maribacter antarcticus]|uniref:alpha/beta hydrolase family protein n=1 Tax=Maribacter antarcticus TaxID=505250 RepID=UPI00047D877B|nr:alpha/beta hydrolase [Maribacter antarcticus]
MNKISKIIILIILLLVSTIFLWGKTNYQSQVIHFQFQSDTIEGVVNLPNKKYSLGEKTPLVIFVHGDGALPRDAYGYYKHIWNELAKKGIASMSWDKKGIGESTGKWLNQSMEDRANEVIAAIDFMKADPRFDFSSIGLIGFSQAGWVMPKVATLSDYPDFIISVSGAINWKRQSNYLTRTRMELEGANKEAIEAGVRQNEIDFIIFNATSTYSDYVAYQKEKCKNGQEEGCDFMSENRFYFVKKNILSDAEQDLKNIQCPIFGVFGSEDLNVDFEESHQTYERIFSTNNTDNYQLKIYPEAEHGLLKSKHFSAMHPGIGFLVKLELFGKRAFVNDVLSDISAFVIQNSK